MRWSLLIFLTLLAGCNGGPGVTPDPHPISSINGIATFNEPILVFEEYDGFEPLDAQLYVGLFDSNGRLYQVTSRSQTDSDQLSISEVPFGFEMSRYFFAEGDYEVRAFIPETLGEQLGDGWYNGFVPRLYGSALPFTFNYGEDYHGLRLDATFPATVEQRVDLPVEVLIHGNPPERGIVQVLLGPAAPTPGVLGDTGLLWSERGRGWMGGRYSFVIPNVPADDYLVSYAGYHLRDPGSPLQVSQLPLTVAPGAELVLAVSTLHPLERPVGLGSISGTVRFTGDPPEKATVMAMRTDAPALTGNDSEQDQQERYRYAFWHPPLDAPDTGNAVDVEYDYMLGWLEAGIYEVSLFTYGGQIYDRIEGLQITLSAPEVRDVDLEE